MGLFYNTCTYAIFVTFSKAFKSLKKTTDIKQIYDFLPVFDFLHQQFEYIQHLVQSKLS